VLCVVLWAELNDPEPPALALANLLFVGFFLVDATRAYVSMCMNWYIFSLLPSDIKLHLFLGFVDLIWGVLTNIATDYIYQTSAQGVCLINAAKLRLDDPAGGLAFQLEAS
jgi:hypothetical protein